MNRDLPYTPKVLQCPQHFWPTGYIEDPQA
jgi:hypothetical protein